MDAYNYPCNMTAKNVVAPVAQRILGGIQE
jgi:hypothetical protein